MHLRRLTPLLAAAVLAVATAGCENTVRGLGQDMQKAGKAIEKATSGTGSSEAAPKPKQ